MPKYPKPIRRLLKQSAKFRKRLNKALTKALTKHDEKVDLVNVNSALEMVDREIVRLGQKKVVKKP